MCIVWSRSQGSYSTAHNAVMKIDWWSRGHHAGEVKGIISKHGCLLNGSRRQLLKNGLLSGTRISVSIQDHVIPADLWITVLTRPNYTRMCHFPAIHCQVQRGWTRTMDVGNKSDCSGSFCLLVDLIMVTEWLLCWTIEKWLLILCIDFPPSNLPPTVNTVWKRQKDNFICQRRALLRPFQ